MSTMYGIEVSVLMIMLNREDVRIEKGMRSLVGVNMFGLCHVFSHHLEGWQGVRGLIPPMPYRNSGEVCAEHVPEMPFTHVAGTLLSPVYKWRNLVYFLVTRQAKLSWQLLDRPSFHPRWVCFFPCKLGLGDERLPGCCAVSGRAFLGSLCGYYSACIKSMCHHLPGGWSGQVRPFCILISSSVHGRSHTVPCCVGLPQGQQS